MTDNVPCKSQAGRTSRAVIVDVVDWDLGHAELIEDSLSAGGISVAVTCHTLVDIVVVDLGIKHGLNTRLEPEFGIINLASGLDELGHADAEDVAWFAAFDNHFECCMERLEIESGLVRYVVNNAKAEETCSIQKLGCCYTDIKS